MKFSFQYMIVSRKCFILQIKFFEKIKTQTSKHLPTINQNAESIVAEAAEPTRKTASERSGVHSMRAVPSSKQMPNTSIDYKEGKGFMGKHRSVLLRILAYCWATEPSSHRYLGALSLSIVVDLSIVCRMPIVTKLSISRCDRYVAGRVYLNRPSSKLRSKQTKYMR